MMKFENLKIRTTGFVFSVLIVFLFSSLAWAGWWDKGVDILKSIGTDEAPAELTLEEIGAGLKEALQVGSENVVRQLGRTDGFNLDSNIHIPLPDSLDKVKTMLTKVGMSRLFEDLELKLNRAAETATPKARQLFLNAISQMTFDDIRKIYDGPDDAATQYFRQTMTPDLTEEMRPVIDDSLSQVGAVQAYDNMMSQYKSLPFVPDVKADLTNHVIEKGMDGIFYYMAKEEAAIRKDPVKRTTELLQKVFTR